MKWIVVLGGGESGTGSAVLAKTKGFNVFLSDAGAIEACYKSMLERYGISYEEDGHSPDKILDAGEVIKSPGIPDHVPLVREIRAKGIPVLSEIEFAGRYCRSKIIAVTGSNGKTTTATLIHELLKNGGMNVGLGGNIGKSFALQVAAGHMDWYVLELSSFQLDDTHTFNPHIGILLNITPDHLDRYDYRMDKYIASKFRIARNMTENDWFVYCGDDANIAAEVDNHLNEYKMRVAPFTRYDRSFKSAYLHDTGLRKEIVVQEGRVERFRIGTEELKIKGIHNVYNVMAAVIAARLAGVGDESIRKTLRAFTGVEHRMEIVAVKQGITYINDSKATNVDSAYYALESMERPVVWIAGGTDKGNDYGPLLPLAKEKVKVLICMGTDNEKLKQAFAGTVPLIYDTHSLSEAVRRMQESAIEGDVVLLSPACASFDLFKNYEDRGRKFKEAVLGRKEK